MLFNLTPALVSKENNIETKPNIIRAIEHVLRSVWASKHLVTADLETVIKLKEIITCRDSLSVLIHLENNYSFLNYDSITYSINIIVGDNIIQQETIEDVLTMLQGVEEHMEDIGSAAFDLMLKQQQQPGNGHDHGIDAIDDFELI